MNNGPSTGDITDPHQNLAFNLVGLAVLIALLAIGVAYALDALVHGDETAPVDGQDGYTIEKNVSGQALSLPLAWLTFPEQNHDGFVDRIDLLLPLKFDAAGHTATVSAVFLPRNRVRPSAQLLDSVYLHRFDAAQLSGPNGLVGKKLIESDGYQKETVWYDPISPNPFVAKCTQPVVPTSGAKCLRTLTLPSGLALQLTFDETLLIYWRQMDSALTTPLNAIGAGPLR